MLQATAITLQTGHKRILDEVDLTVHPGAFTALVGPNGAGKSSLLKVLSLEHTRFQGWVTVNGRDIAAYSVKELSLVRAVLPQHTTVQFSFTAEQIVMLGRMPHRAKREENNRVVREVMELTGTWELRRRNYATLSGGEQQRVQLARVLAQVWEETVYPRYILLDEPTSSLDIAQQQYIFGLARQMCSRNIGVLAIVHDLNQAARFADYLCFLRGGKVIASGKTREVFTQANIEKTFCCPVSIHHDSCNDCPYILPVREPDQALYNKKLNIN